MTAYHTIPQDVLFFRDGRPMEVGAGSGGHGARWPEPSIIFDAVHAALHRAFPVPPESMRNAESFQQYLKERDWLWQHPHRYIRRPKNGEKRERSPDEKFRNQRFGALRTAGPFPSVVRGSEKPIWLFPAPADFLPFAGHSGFMVPLRDGWGSSSLPSPLKYSLGNPCEPSKEQAEPWWSKSAIEAALRNETPAPGETWAASELYAGEWTTGIGIDPDTLTQDGERIYSAEYLRLSENIRGDCRAVLGFTASLMSRTTAPASADGMRNLFPAHDIILCGGQQRACRVEPIEGGFSLSQLFPISQFDAAKPNGDGKWQVKWLLLSPAIYPWISDASPGGWLPNWIAAKDGVDHGRRFKAGEVLLKPEIPLKEQGESRQAWRERISREIKPISAKLVAARVPKPIVVTGWSERLHEIAGLSVEPSAAHVAHGPRSTLLAVPAGAVYYFEACSQMDAAALANALNWHGDPKAPDFGMTIKNRRSTLLGEKGFGLGVCGTWDFMKLPLSE